MFSEGGAYLLHCVILGINFAIRGLRIKGIESKF